MTSVTATPSEPLGAPAASEPKKNQHSLRQNAAAVAAGQLATWLLTAITLAMLPRYLGPERMGQMGIGMSYQMLVMTFAGLGIGTLLTRDAARDSDATARLMSTAVWLSVTCGVVASAAATAIAVASGYSVATTTAIALTLMAAPLLLVQVVFGAVLQGLEVMRYQAIWDTAAKVALLAALGAVMVAGWGLAPLLIIVFAATALITAPAFVVTRRYLEFNLASFSFDSARYLVVGGLPFLAVGIFLVLYLSVDVIQLSYLSGEHSVGIYSAPARIFGTLLFVPNIVTIVTFPKMAAAFHDNPAKLARLARPTLRLAIATTLPVTILAVGLADDALVAFIGEGYAQSGPVIAMLAVSLVPTSVLIVTHRILIAANRQNVWTVVMLLAVGVKVGLNFVLIPAFDGWFGNPALGAAASLVAVETLMMLSTFWLMPRDILDGASLRFYAKVVVAAAIAAVALAASLPLGIFAAAVVACSAYVFAALATRAHTVGEFRSAMSWAAGRVAS